MTKTQSDMLARLDPFIVKTAGRLFFGAEDAEDAAQEGRLTCVLAMRSWREESGASLYRHCVRNILWRLSTLKVLASKRAQSERPAPSVTRRSDVDWQEGTNEGYVDPAALDPERALIVLEVWDSLTDEQRAAIDDRIVNGIPRGSHNRALVAEAARTAAKALELRVA